MLIKFSFCFKWCISFLKQIRSVHSTLFVKDLLKPFTWNCPDFWSNNLEKHIWFVLTLRKAFSLFSHLSVFHVLLTNPDSSAPFKVCEHPGAREAFWGCRYAAQCTTLRLLPSPPAHGAAQPPGLLLRSVEALPVLVWELGLFSTSEY